LQFIISKQKIWLFYYFRISLRFFLNFFLKFSIFSRTSINTQETIWNDLFKHDIQLLFLEDFSYIFIWQWLVETYLRNYLPNLMFFFSSNHFNHFHSVMLESSVCSTSYFRSNWVIISYSSYCEKTAAKFNTALQCNETAT
jgi:hypothetical protein